ncbi:hypothetical protein LTR15_001358 [Elasticomyces elasticus]|nr:hypothetical protein LTR15_001358 [Elasticomyces elasticus]
MPRRKLQSGLSSSLEASKNDTTSKRTRRKNKIKQAVLGGEDDLSTTQAASSFDLDSRATTREHARQSVHNDLGTPARSPEGIFQSPSELLPAAPAISVKEQFQALAPASGRASTQQKANITKTGYFGSYQTPDRPLNANPRGQIAPVSGTIQKENIGNRLRTAADHVMSDQYHYTPISADEVRLIRLEKGELLDRMEVTLFTVPFRSLGTECKFHALSYNWGDDIAAVPLTIYDGNRPPRGTSSFSQGEDELSQRRGQMRVKNNTYEALRGLRQPKEHVCLWVDALCINQEDLGEKTVHVPRLKDIYLAADKVSAYLGHNVLSGEARIQQHSNQYGVHGDRSWKARWRFNQFEPQIEGCLAGAIVSCLADKGAGRNIISLACAQRLGATAKNRMSGTPTRATLGNGKLVKTVGLVTLPFSFRNENEVHHLEFHVMPECVRDVILGSPFLRLTQTFERFAHRIRRTLRACMPYRMQYMGSAERVVGTLNGSVVNALPDTGSDVMLISEAYARQRRLSIDRNEIYQRPLQLADGSFDRTSGIVKDATWAYGLFQDETLVCDFYVLPTLMCDVLLSYDFLDSTEAFTKHDCWFIGSDEISDTTANGIWALSTITMVPKIMQKLRQHLASSNDKGRSTSSSLTVTQVWEREQRRLLRAYESNESQVSKLPLEQRDSARATYIGIWQPAYDKHMRSRPGS